MAETHVACLLRDGTICRMRYVEEEPGPFMETKDKRSEGNHRWPGQLSVPRVKLPFCIELLASIPLQ